MNAPTPRYTIWLRKQQLMACSWGRRWLTVACICCLHHWLAAASAGKYNPCTTPGIATRGRGFYVGLAFWPGGSVEDWLPVQDPSTGYIGLNPCETARNYNGTGLSDQQYLTRQGVVFAAFELAVDSLTSLEINVTDINSTFSSIGPNKPDVVSVVVFRGPFRSEARYVRSEDAVLTQGTGFVQSLAFRSEFSQGQLTDFAWTDLTCDGCGGRTSPTCMLGATAVQPQYSCTVLESECGVADCSLVVYTAFTGSDRSGLVFTSGPQLQQINLFSLTSYYDAATSKVVDLLRTSSTTTVGEVPTTPSDPSGAAA